MLSLSHEAAQANAMPDGDVSAISTLRRILADVEAIDEVHHKKVELLEESTKVRYYLARQTEAMAVAAAPLGERDMSEPIALYDAVLCNYRVMAAAGHATEEDIARALNNLGVCYREGSMFDEALACYEEAYALMPRMSKLKVNMERCRAHLWNEKAKKTNTEPPDLTPHALRHMHYDDMNDPAFLLHSIARITGLQSRSDLNGKAAKVTAYDVDKGRYAVQVHDATVLIKPENLRAIREDDDVTLKEDKSSKGDVMPVYTWAATPLGRLDALIGAHGFEQVCTKGSHLEALYTSNIQWEEGLSILETTQKQDKRSLRKALRLISNALWSVQDDFGAARSCRANWITDLDAALKLFQPISGPEDVVEFIRRADLADANVQCEVEMSIRSASIEAWLLLHHMPARLGRNLHQAEMQHVVNRARQACMLRCLTCWRAIEQLQERFFQVRADPAPWDAVANGVKRGIAWGQMQQHQRDAALLLLKRVKGADLASCICSPGPLLLSLKQVSSSAASSGIRVARDDEAHGACLSDSDHPGVLEARAARHMNNGMLPRLPTGDQTPFERTGYYAAYEDYMKCARLAQDGCTGCLADGYFWEAANSLGLAGGRDGKGVKVDMLRALAAKAEAAEAKARGIYRWATRNTQAKTAVKDVLKSCEGVDSRDVLSELEYYELSRRGMNLTPKTVKPHGIQTLENYDITGLGGVWIADSRDRAPPPDDATKARWKSRILSLMRCGHCNTANDGFELLMPCSACKAVSYCGRECQKAHWKHHKKQCSELKQLRDEERVCEQLLNPCEHRAVTWVGYNVSQVNKEEIEWKGINWQTRIDGATGTGT